jgi:hypothetical protein
MLLLDSHSNSIGVIFVSDMIMLCSVNGITNTIVTDTKTSQTRYESRIFALCKRDISFAL